MADQITEAVPEGPYSASILAGARVVEDIARVAETEVQALLDRVERAVAEMLPEAEREARRRVAPERERLALLRADLVMRANALARGYGAVIALLDEADEAMTPAPGTTAGTHGSDRPIEALRSRPAKRTVAVPVEARPAVMAVAAPEAAQPARVRIAAAPAPPAQADGAETEPAELRPRRWWRRWTRQAA